MNTQQEGFGSGMATEGRAGQRKGNSCTQLGKPPPIPPLLSLHPWSSVIFSNSEVLLNPNQDRADLSCLRKQAQGTVYSLTSKESPEGLLGVTVWTHPPAGERRWRCCFLAGCTVPGKQESPGSGGCSSDSFLLGVQKGWVFHCWLHLCVCLTSVDYHAGGHDCSLYVWVCLGWRV